MNSARTIAAVAAMAATLALLGCERTSSSPPAYNPTPNEQALNDIQSFARNLCTSATATGKTQSVSASAEAEGELKGLVKKLANLGFKGAAEIRDQSYEGVLQSELSPLLTADAKCRYNVFNVLQEKLLRSPSDASTDSPARVTNSATTGDNGVILQDVKSNRDINVQR